MVSKMAQSFALRLAAALMCLVVSFHYAFVILPPAAAQVSPGILPDLYPAWYATRVVLFGSGDPYRPEVTRQIQTAMYEDKFAGGNEQRFAYPIFAALLFAPFAALPFAEAQTCFIALAALLTGLSVLAWLGSSAPPKTVTFCVVLWLATFPVMLGLELRQPTMLVAALLAGTLACLHSGRLVTAGVLAAMASAKPQLAIGVLVPVLLWAFADWYRRKSFVFSLWGTMAALLAVSERLLHGWLWHWLATMRAYAGYAGAKPLVCVLPGFYPPLILGTLLIAASIAVSWKWRRTDLLLAIGFSVTVFQVLIPFQFYNEVMLLPGVLWTVVRGNQSTHKLQLLLRSCIWGSLVLGWVAMAVTSMAHALRLPFVAKLWWSPLFIAWIFPIALLAYLAFCASAQEPVNAIPIQASFAESRHTEAPCA